MLKIKKGDNVIVLSGKDKNKKGKVVKILPKSGKIVVEGVNMITKHVRPRRQGEKGQRVQLNAPIVSSKVKLICPQCNKSTRVGFKVLNESKKRLCKKCQATF